MKLGLGSYALAGARGVAGDEAPPRPLTAVDLVMRARELGLGLVQICDNLPLHSLPPAELDDLAARAAAAGVAIEVGTRGIAPAHLRRYLALAQRLGSDIVRVVVDTAAERPSLDEIVATLRPLLPEFAAAGVRLAIENHDRFAARDLVAVLQALDSPWVGICLDTVNSFGALEGPEAVVAALGPWTVNLHIKDFDVQRLPSNMGFLLQGRPAGQGRLDVPWLLGELARYGREVNAILEQWPLRLDTMVATVAQEAAWAAASVAYLRRLIPD
jgi:sugar phosphate isomerase/epimerase